MKLFYSPTSPFARKVLACAMAREIDGQIALLSANPWADPPDLVAANPLSKVPCLLTEDGMALYDSPVICEYLESVEGTMPMFPRAGGALWKALRYQAMADGIMDAAVLRRMEGMKPNEPERAAWIARQKAAIARTLAVLEQDPPHEMLDIGAVSVGCALGYLDFRFAEDAWRDGHPRLAGFAAWLEGQPCMARTAPPPA